MGYRRKWKLGPNGRGIFSFLLASRGKAKAFGRSGLRYIEVLGTKNTPTPIIGACPLLLPLSPRPCPWPGPSSAQPGDGGDYALLTRHHLHRLPAGREAGPQEEEEEQRARLEFWPDLWGPQIAQGPWAWAPLDHTIIRHWPLGTVASIGQLSCIIYIFCVQTINCALRQWPCSGLGWDVLLCCNQ